MKLFTQNIAVIIPCYNEEKTINSVITGFRKSLPEAKIYVFDNNSLDATGSVAEESGAIVRKVSLPGKGNVVRRMFADIEADVYIMVDGDDTYDATAAPILVEKLVSEGLDMVVGCRHEDSRDNNNYRRGHRLGNRLLTRSVQRMFKGEFTDMLSGYRAFSKRFVKSFPAESAGFETETELTVFSLEMRLPYGEVVTSYRERPAGSQSKLSTYKDGMKILLMIVRLYSNELPLRFWGVVGSGLIIVALALAAPVVLDYFATGIVLRMPTLIVASGLAVSGFMAFTIGLVLRTVTTGRRETKHLKYLSLKAPREEGDRSAES